MSYRPIAIVLSTVVAVPFFAEPVYGQLPAGLGGAAQSTQAQVQQRVQTQVQQRAQVQVQQQVRVQAQAQLQAEAARAAQIAQRASAMARQAAAARQSARGATALNAEARLQQRNRGAEFEGTARADVQRNGSAHAEAYTRLGLDPNISLPAGISQADVQIYNNIFGRFNPLLARQEPAPASSQPSSNSERAESKRQDSRQPNSDQADSQPRGPQGQVALGIGHGLDLASRIQVAVRERRAEISQLRDRALATNDVQLLLQADRMELAMNAFVEAQARGQVEGDVAVGDQAEPSASSVQLEGQSQGDARLRTASRPERASSSSGSQPATASSQQPNSTGTRR